MEWLTDPQAWMALATLTALEIVLGVDNIVFISILAGKLPEHQRLRAWRLGLSVACLTRLGLLFTLTWMMGLTQSLFTVLETDISWRDVILISGGLFLLMKSTLEIHENIEGIEASTSVRAAASFVGIIIQIGLLDIVFSLDSVITAIGLANRVFIMALAIVIAVIFMLMASRHIDDFVHRFPTIKILALSFLLLIGIALIGQGFDLHIPKGYIYFAMAFSLFVEMLNMKIRSIRAKT